MPTGDDVVGIAGRKSYNGLSARRRTMNHVFLKYLCLLLATTVTAASCALVSSGDEEDRELHTPFHAGAEPFPEGQAQRVDRIAALIQACRNGSLIGKSIYDKHSGLYSTYMEQYAPLLQPSVTAPDGNGKIYTLYLTRQYEYTYLPFDDPPALGKIFRSITEVRLYGYTFKLETTDEDIITECRATRVQLRSAGSADSVQQ